MSALVLLFLAVASATIEVEPAPGVGAEVVITVRDDLERAPNGKANYALIRDYALQALAG